MDRALSTYERPATDQPSLGPLLAAVTCPSPRFHADVDTSMWDAGLRLVTVPRVDTKRANTMARPSARYAQPSLLLRATMLVSRGPAFRTTGTTCQFTPRGP